MNSCIFLNRYWVFCMLQFCSSTASTISLCMSAYGLAYNIHEPWAWQNYTISACIITTIITNSIKDALISNYEIFKQKQQQTGEEMA